MKIRINEIFSDYCLIDCGNKMKLEKFGAVTLIRPEISATTSTELSINEWKAMADAQYVENDHLRGHWEFFDTAVAQQLQAEQTWQTVWQYGQNTINIRLQLSAFKHTGIFPEQALNWTYLADKQHSEDKPLQILNLFGYTGVASLVAAQQGSALTHVDSLKQVVERGKKNMTDNGISQIRWMVDDSRAFVAREIRRQKLYDGIILDPPVSGQGSGGKFWKLEKDLEPLLQQLRQIVKPRCFIILNLYSSNINVEYLRYLQKTYFFDFEIEVCDSIEGLSNKGNSIHHGFLLRLKRL